MNCACPAGAATAIQLELPLLAPRSGNVAWVKARSKAIIRANWPISGTITYFTAIVGLRF
jgi:hypothetical protein